ncbi:uncharacterized protein [Henckelia pumila]|uniref:uncharacterized protein n=1 Tax=Henckelia pumila TaxID=405737 RepID=UPI003C6E229E
MDEFNHFVLESALVDAGFEGSSLTWTNKSIWKHLDRVFVSVDWGDHFNSVRVEHLSRTVSDHCPLLVSAPVFARGPSSFRFQSMWTRHPGFLQTIRLNWNMPCSLQGMPRLFAKLKRLKGHLKWWNRDVFGNLFDNIAEAERSVRLAEAACEADPSEHFWTLLSRCNEELSRVTALEADFWKQKAACNWLEDGERNTKLFHNMVKKKNVFNKIFRIWEDGICLTSPGLIKQSGAAISSASSLETPLSWIFRIFLASPQRSRRRRTLALPPHLPWRRFVLSSFPSLGIVWRAPMGILRFSFRAAGFCAT